jgi:hypothetical protein
MTSVAMATEGVKLVETTRSIPERGKVASARIIDGTDRTAFIVPPGWRMGASQAEKKIVLQSEDYGASCEIRIQASAADKLGSELTSEQFRDQVLSRNARSKVLKEYIWPTRLGRAFAFEVETIGEQGVKHRSRVFFVAREGALLEFNLTAKGNQFDTFQKTFENLVASFRDE